MSAVQCALRASTRRNPFQTNYNPFNIQITGLTGWRPTWSLSLAHKTWACERAKTFACRRMSRICVMPFARSRAQVCGEMVQLVIRLQSVRKDIINCGMCVCVCDCGVKGIMKKGDTPKKPSAVSSGRVSLCGTCVSRGFCGQIVCCIMLHTHTHTCNAKCTCCNLGAYTINTSPFVDVLSQATEQTTALAAVTNTSHRNIVAVQFSTECTTTITTRDNHREANKIC